MSTTGTRRFGIVSAAGLAIAALVLGGSLSASAATPGVGDVSDAMRYDVAGPFGTIVSDLSGEDDESNTEPAPFPINFFGVMSAGVCITTNGGFFPVPTAGDSCNAVYDSDVEHLALGSNRPMIAALAGDVDLEECDDNTPDGWGTPCEIYFGTTTIDGRDAFIITWYRVSMNSADNDPALSNTFQLVIIKKATGDDTVGWDFDIEFNYGTLRDGEEGYSAEDPSSSCLDEIEGNPDCRWGVGWANYLVGDPEEADTYELFAGTPVSALLDGGASSLVTHSLNSAVLGRYTFGMVGGVTQGFSVPDMTPELAATGPYAVAPLGIAALAGGLGLGLVLLSATRRTRRAQG